MLLTLDIGNSNITCGVFEDKVLVSSFRFATNKKISAIDCFLLFKKNFKEKSIKIGSQTGIIISSVVPELNVVLEKVFKDNFNILPIFVDSSLKLNIKLKVDNPMEVGSDRITNSVAGFKRVKSDVIIVDLGTATTFDCVTKDGNFLGGLILPGISISASALFNSTSQLSEVELKKPKNLIGKNTLECIQSGLMNGYSEMVEGLLFKLEEEMKSDCYVIATGGLSKIVLGDSSRIKEIDENLTLKGLKTIYELNS